MFGSIGGFELLVLAAIGLLVFGPRRLPEIGRTVGRTLAEFRKAALELRTSIEREINLEEVKETTRSIQKAIEGDLMQEPLQAPKDQAPAPQAPGAEAVHQDGLARSEAPKTSQGTGDVVPRG